MSHRVLLQTIYRRLYSYFGPQSWWPATSPFEVIVGAILTQNTNWSNVEKAIRVLKKEKLLSFARLSQSPEKVIAQAIRPSGYYRIKARRLKNVIAYMQRAYGGSLPAMRAQQTDSLRQELCGVNGIGPETADSILVYALQKPSFVVDAYTRRVLERHGLIPAGIGYAQVQNLFMKNLKIDVQLFNEYHALIVRLAKEFCTKRNPSCGRCPLQSLLPSKEVFGA